MQRVHMAQDVSLSEEFLGHHLLCNLLDHKLWVRKLIAKHKKFLLFILICHDSQN